VSVSFIYQNMTFFYRIDSHSSSLPFIAWGCRQLPISGSNIASKEAMMEDIKAKLKQYYRNRKPKADAESVANNRSVPVCDTCGLTSPKMEGQSTCPDCLTEPTTNK
jgi:rubrerythrin